MDFSVIEYICINEDEEISKANIGARYGNDTKLTKYFKRINNNNHSTRGSNDNPIQRYDVHVEREQRTSLDAAGNLKYNCFTFTSTFRSSVVCVWMRAAVLGPCCVPSHKLYLKPYAQTLKPKLKHKQWTVDLITILHGTWHTTESVIDAAGRN